MSHNSDVAAHNLSGGNRFVLTASVALLFVLLAQRFLLPPHEVPVGRLLSMIMTIILMMGAAALLFTQRTSKVEATVLLYTGLFAVLSGISALASSALFGAAEFELSGAAEYLSAPFIGASVFVIAFRAAAAYGVTWLFTRLLLLFCYPMLIGFWQFANGDFFIFSGSFDEVVARAVASLFVHPNVFGLTSFVALVMAFTLWKNATPGRSRGLAVLLMFGTGLAIFLAQGRASIIGLISFLLILLLLRSPLFRLISLFLLLPIAVLAFYSLGVGALDSGKGLTSFWWRVSTWNLVLQSWQMENLLVGYGPGWMELRLAYWNRGVLQVHNDFIFLAMQSDALAATAYFSLFLILPMSLLTKPRLPDRSTAMTLLAFGITVLIISVTENVYLDVTVRIMMWALLGGLAGAASFLRENDVNARLRSTHPPRGKFAPLGA